jgi:hypothetical protein
MHPLSQSHLPIANNLFRDSVLLSIDTVVLLRIDTHFYLTYTVTLLYKHNSFAFDRHSAILKERSQGKKNLSLQRRRHKVSEHIGRNIKITI